MTTGTTFVMATAILTTLVRPGPSSQSAGGPTRAERVATAASRERHRLDFDGERFSGPAWQWLVNEGRKAQFFLIGEQHGISENARLAAALFEALVPAGYENVAIETSPAMASVMDRILQEAGLNGLRELFAQPGAEPAFFGMKEEAEFLAATRAVVTASKPVLWGLDYEVAADRHLARLLRAKPKPAEATQALSALEAASEQSWSKYRETRNPRHIFTFSGDPALVRPIEDAWPERDAETSWILDTLEATLYINELWSDGQGFLSNEARVELLRSNFLRYWRSERTLGRTPKVLFKFGASHMMRGLSSNETYDLGALLPEIAALEGTRSFSLLVLAGAGSMTAVFDPVNWTYEPARPRDPYDRGLEPLLEAGLEDAFTLIDLRSLRPVLPSAAREDVSYELMRVVHGFDALLILTGSTPSAVLPRKSESRPHHRFDVPAGSSR